MRKFLLLILFLIYSVLAAGCNLFFQGKGVSNKNINENPVIYDTNNISDNQNSIETLGNKTILSEIEILKQSFKGDIINGKIDENQLTTEPSTIAFSIKGNNTLYFIDNFGIAIELGNDWKGGKIQNAYEGKNLSSIRLMKNGNKTYGILLPDNKYYSDDNMQPDEVLLGKNNKYHFIVRTVENGGVEGKYNIIIYDAK